jgi:hypothetical protein
LVNRVKAANSLLIDLVDIEGAEIQRSHPHRSSKGRLLPLFEPEGEPTGEHFAV